MKGWGPVFAYYFGIDEVDVYNTWTEERFRRYQEFAEHLMKQGADRG